MTLAEALTVNTTLRVLQLDQIDALAGVPLPIQASLGVQSYEVDTYEAFAAMLRFNTNLVLKLPPLDRAVRDEISFEAFGQMRIEQRSNRVGRGRLMASRQTTKEEWVDALRELSTDDVDDEPEALRLSCLFSLFQLNPEVVSMS